VSTPPQGIHAANAQLGVGNPIVVRGSTVAIVQFVFERREDRRAARESEATLSRVKQYIKESLPVIETKRLMNTLREASLRDPMAGLHNRRYLHDDLHARSAPCIDAPRSSTSCTKALAMSGLMPVHGGVPTDPGTTLERAACSRWMAWPGLDSAHPTRRETVIAHRVARVEAPTTAGGGTATYRGHTSGTDDPQPFNGTGGPGLALPRSRTPSASASAPAHRCHGVSDAT
jgi:hypothetical protein